MMRRRTCWSRCLILLVLAGSIIYVLLPTDFTDLILAQFWNRKQFCQSASYLHPKAKEASIYRSKAIRSSDQVYNRLQLLSSIVAAKTNDVHDYIPIVPAVSADGHLLVLSVAASRIRYGTSLTFIMVYPTDMKQVLPQHIQSEPLSAHSLNLWCIFDDGSTTPAYSCDSDYGYDRASLLDCPLSPYASDQLWRYNRTLRVHLASLTTTEQKPSLIVKAYVSAPVLGPMFSNSSGPMVTLCTSPLENAAESLKQWILFHYLVGVRKFVVYNTSDANQQMRHVIEQINQHYPALVDIVSWNFSSLSLRDALGGRYFQVEALHDCLIRYGDQSEWLGVIDTDEYIVPMSPYTTIPQHLYEKFGHLIIGSVNLWSHFFCTERADEYTSEESDRSRLVIERFIHCAAHEYRKGREKYLYRPRFVQYLSIHHQIVGLSKQQMPTNSIMLAHYFAMNYLRSAPGCHSRHSVRDVTVRDRFAKPLKEAMRWVSSV